MSEATCPPCGHLSLSHNGDGCAHPTCTCISDPTGDTSIPLVGADLSRIADAVDVDPLKDDPHAWPRSAFAKGGHVSSGQAAVLYPDDFPLRRPGH